MQCVFVRMSASQGPTVLSVFLTTGAVPISLSRRGYWTGGILLALQKLGEDGHSTPRCPELRPFGSLRGTMAAETDPESLPTEGFITKKEWEMLSNALRLSPRELQLMQGVFEEMKDRAIASRLGISTHTVRTHFERLFRKLGVRSRAGVLVIAFKLIRVSTVGQLVLSEPDGSRDHPIRPVG
jgi:DNA-binding CsgD family transcriptional regulator